MHEDLPIYTESDQGLDQDRRAVSPETVPSLYRQHRLKDVRKKIAADLRGGFPVDERRNALDAVARHLPRQTRNAPSDTDENLRAVIYVRVSTRDQARTGGGEEGYSIPYQREACLGKAQTLGAVVVDEYVDAGESAKTTHRPELQRLLKDLKKRGIKYLIVHKLDRLARNREDDMAIRLSLARAGVELVSCTENLSNSAHGRFVHNILADTAEFYRENLAEEVMKGLTRKAQEGGTPFRAPIGYLNDRRIVEGVSISFVAVDQVRGPIIRWCFEQYATGEWTVANLVIAARSRGLTTRPTRTKPSGEISPATMHNLLHNPYYMGLVPYQGMHYEGRHEPLVEPETWLRVQDLLAANNHSGEKDRKWPHYLRGTIYCGDCGGRLVYSRNRGNGGLYEYYFCVKKKTRTSNCVRGGVRLSAVEDGISRFYAIFQPTQVRIAEIKDEVLAELRAQTADARSHADRARRRRTQLVDERAKLMQAHYAGAVPVDLLKTEMDRLTRALSDADTAIAATTATLDKVEATLNLALLVASTCHQQYQAATPAIRRQINQGFFRRLYIAPDGSIERYEMTEPFRQLFADPADSSALAARPSQTVVGEAADDGADATARDRTRPSAVLARSFGHGNKTTPDNDLVRRGLNKNGLVGTAGFEPATPRL